MEILTEQQQIDILRNKCENAKNRIWIASPFIGTLKDVQRIIGGKWLLPSINCRILTDADSGFIRKDTFDEFINNQVDIIRNLESLHAKIYIVDDWCLVTSANLTGTAFFCRYEMGIATNDIEKIESTYIRWWNMAKPVSVMSQMPQKTLVEYQDGARFKKKFKSQPYVSGKQDKYDALCEKYKEFAKLYEKVTGRNPQMVKDGYTLLQEVDYLFNYLSHDHPDKPSHEQKEVRQLTDKQREKAIIKYFKDMSRHYVDDPQLWRLERANMVQKLLAPDAIKKIGWNEAREITDCLHCLESYKINKIKFLNPKNNNIEDIRDCWNVLLHTGKIDNNKITIVKNRLRNFAWSSIRELIGWYYPNDYPLMNETSHRGMRFFGYNIK